MADPSTFAHLDDAQLHYLKAQYLTSLQMVDQAETALKAQLDQIGKTRRQLQELMGELDSQITAATTPEAPPKPDRATGKTPPRRTPRKRPVTH